MTDSVVEGSLRPIDLARTPLYADFFPKDGAAVDAQGRRQQKASKAKVGALEIAPFRELFGEDAEMGSEWDYSVDSEGQVRIPGESRSDEVEVEATMSPLPLRPPRERKQEEDKSKTGRGRDKKVEEEEGEEGGRSLWGGSESDDGHFSSSSCDSMPSEQRKREAAEINDFFRNPPEGIVMQKAVGMSGEEYAKLIDHHFRTGKLYPDPPKPLHGDCRPRLVRFAETMRPGPLRACVEALAVLPLAPPCDRTSFLTVAKGLPGGGGKGGSRHRLGPILWGLVEGMLRGDAFSEVSRGVEEAARREAVVDGAKASLGGEALASRLFLTDEEVRRARREEVKRTPYHKIMINFTDGETGEVTLRNITDLDHEAQVVLAPAAEFLKVLAS